MRFSDYNYLLYGKKFIYNGNQTRPFLGVSPLVLDKKAILYTNIFTALPPLANAKKSFSSRITNLAPLFTTVNFTNQKVFYGIATKNVNPRYKTFMVP